MHYIFCYRKSKTNLYFHIWFRIIIGYSFYQWLQTLLLSFIQEYFLNKKALLILFPKLRVFFLFFLRMKRIRSSTKLPKHFQPWTIRRRYHENIKKFPSLYRLHYKLNCFANVSSILIPWNLGRFQAYYV